MPNSCSYIGKSNFQRAYHTHKNIAILYESHTIGFKKKIQDENPDQLILQLIS